VSSTFDRVSLSWLPSPPADFRQRCRSLGESPQPGPEARRLASFRLDGNALASLSKAIGRLRAARETVEGLQRLTLALVGDGSPELVRDALIASAARYGLLLDVIPAPFNAAEAALLDRDSEIQRAKPDAVLLGFTHHAYGQAAGSFDSQRVGDELVDDSIQRMQRLADAVRLGCGASVIWQTVPRPSATLFGSFDRRLPATSAAVFDRLNDAIVQLAAGPDVLFDAAALAERVGLDHWHDPAQWYAYRLPFSQRLVPLYADCLARTVAAMRGLSRKCLVLDLDNTIWGGVIGDDGLEGIRLGEGLAEGEAFLEVQRLAKRLRQRGVILAVSSKNDESVARHPFRAHPDMLLSEGDITVFQANWSDKATNLKAIARELEFGLDAIVLLDDNPAERALVRQELPDVAVPELPDDPSLFPDALMAAGYFDAVSYSAEDRQRADMYAARARTAELQANAVDLAGFLDSLDMAITLAPFDAIGRARIAQLINKSNQFNLTTRRYTETEVQMLESDRSVRTLQVRLKDRLADHGMIGVVICRVVHADEWFIDTWLMSCRVLGRRVEEAVLQEVVSMAAREGATRLIGRFIPSGRNRLVEDHYRRLGFELVTTDETGSTWLLALDRYTAVDLPFRRTVTA
jgi:FkbH-like protein